MEIELNKMNQGCAMDRAVENYRRQRNLPDNALVPMLLVCPCPKCSPRC